LLYWYETYYRTPATHFSSVAKNSLVLCSKSKLLNYRFKYVFFTYSPPPFSSCSYVPEGYREGGSTVARKRKRDSEGGGRAAAGL